MGRATLTSRLVSQKIGSVEALETLAADAKPRTTHRLSSGGDGHMKEEEFDPERTRRGHHQTQKPFESQLANF